MKLRYDAIIIGSGIGGLTCGCYLAKFGLKVLLLEQHNKPGGCCTSFMKKGFLFNSAVHYLGGVNEGIFGNIINELDLKRTVEFKKIDPVCNMVFPTFSFNLRSDFQDTIQEIIKVFPEENESLKKFYYFTQTEKFIDIYIKIKNKRFDSVLKEYSKNSKIINIFNALMIGSAGLSSEEISAVNAISLLRQYFKDFGYHPLGGAQRLSDGLARVFESSGGEILYNSDVNSIIIEGNKAKGVVVNKSKYYSDNIVSNIDFKQTRRLCNILPSNDFKLSKLKESASFFTLYMAIDEKKDMSSLRTDRWFQLEETPRNHTKLDIDKGNIRWFICCFPFLYDTSNKKRVVEIFTTVNYISKEFWEKNRTKFESILITKAETLIPQLKNSVIFRFNATPTTYERYTRNSKGAAFGWEADGSLSKNFHFDEIFKIKNLYLAGHWMKGVAGQGGVTSVALSGRKTAETILNKNKNFKKFKVLYL